MIRFAAPADLPRLKTLWVDVFGDAPADVDAFFALRHRDENMLVDERGGLIAGMLTMLPFTLQTGCGDSYPARYVYAVGTAREARGQGIATGLLEAAHTHMERMGIAASVLVPASDGLFSFYAKRGYETAFALDVLTLPAEALPPFPKEGTSSPCTAAEYTRIRDLAFLNSSLYARWDAQAVSYAMRTFSQAGGVSALAWEGGSGCAAWEKTENGVLVRELALTQGDIKTALAVLHGQLHAASYTVRLMRGTVPGAPERPFGMIRWLAPKPELAGGAPYLSLALD